MKAHYVLIDYENVQPDDLSRLNGHPSKVLVFVGANQTKIPVELADALQQRGDDGGYVRISGNGKNALDFHIAFHLGLLAARDPAARFHVVSKDTGFDSLMRHLKYRGIRAQRVAGLAEVLTDASVDRESAERLEAIVQNLRTRGDKRPKTEKKLGSTIRSVLPKLPSLDDEEVEALIAELKEAGYLSIENGRVSYNL